MVNIPTDLPLGSGLHMEELITLVPHASLGQDTQDLLIRGLYWARRNLPESGAGHR